MIRLREDQDRAVSDMRHALTLHQSILFRGPTGVGKTVIASFMAQQASARSKRVIFGVHRSELASQTAQTFDAFGIKYGFIASGRPSNPFACAQIASADTLRNRPELLKDTALFVPDEAHLWASKTRAALIQSAKDYGAKIVGLSATPLRLDGKPLTMFDTIVEGPSEAWLIENGHLSGYRAFAPSSPDLSGLHTKMGDYVVSELEERLDKPAIVGNAVEAWRTHADGLRTIVFAISRQHGHHVKQAYEAAGIGAAYIDGTMTADQRKQEITRFADGHAMVLINIALCVEGFDLSAQVGREVPIEAVQLLNPTKSLARARQMMGRALRKKPRPAIILDHVRMIETHGFPDDAREWTLEGRERVAGVTSVEVTTCPSCFTAYRSVLPSCPECGSDKPLKPRTVEEIEGELVEIQKREKTREVRAARDLPSIARVAIERGYKPGWIGKRVEILTGRRVSFSEIQAALIEARR
jgi:DNA repair protein RadD